MQSTTCRPKEDRNDSPRVHDQDTAIPTGCRRTISSHQGLSLALRGTEGGRTRKERHIACSKNPPGTHNDRVQGHSARLKHISTKVYLLQQMSRLCPDHLHESIGKRRSQLPNRVCRTKIRRLHVSSEPSRLVLYSHQSLQLYRIRELGLVSVESRCPSRPGREMSMTLRDGTVRVHVELNTDLPLLTTTP